MPPPIPQSKSFTVRFNGRTNKLPVETLVSKHLNPGADLALEAQKAKKYIGIWDTGATNSVISQKVVDECGLIATGMTMVHSATEEKLCETFFG